MIASMTGFGRGNATAGPFECTIELRTVNSRFCEVSVRGPRELNEHEATIQRLVKNGVARGRVSVSVQLDRTSSAGASLQVDPKAVDAYRTLLTGLKSEAGIDEPLRLDHLLRFQDLFVSAAEDPKNPEYAWDATRRALTEALEALRAMRLVEGDALRTELHSRASSIAERLEEVIRLAPERIPAARTRIRERLEEILAEGRLDPERLEQEMAVLADRLDVTEEIVRLKAHLIAFGKALDSSEPVGRKLNFLSQEINREVNTIGSKANDPDIAHVVVGMKEDLEKIREQIENVE